MRLGISIPMPGLETDAVHEMLTTALAKSVSPSVAATIRGSHGREPPVRARAPRGSLALAGRVPTLLAGIGARRGSAVIQRRLAFLSETSVAMLQAAAVLGPEFTVDDVAAVVDARLDDVTDELEPAIRSGLLTEVHRQLGFGHDLIRQVVLDGMASGRRAACTSELRTSSLADSVRTRPSTPPSPLTSPRRAPRAPMMRAHTGTRPHDACSTSSDTRRRRRASVERGRSRSTRHPGRPSSSPTRATRARAGDLPGHARFAECADVARTSGRATFWPKPLSAWARAHRDSRSRCRVLSR